MRRTIGRPLCAVLAVLDLAGIVGLWQHPGPPAGLVITGTVLGAVTLAAYRPAARGSTRALRVVVGSRVISALLGLPVFFTADAPDWARVTAIVLAMLAPAIRPTAAEQA
ncbi:hypothetical protein [Streptomyces sp. NPDC048419]|uniref:hypothetical protein n=1 Tax=Streptomyces sp. NPDC048419 TaxID=3365547 RepID=UPI00371B39C9